MPEESPNHHESTRLNSTLTFGGRAQALPFACCNRERRRRRWSTFAGEALAGGFIPQTKNRGRPIVSSINMRHPRLPSLHCSRVKRGVTQVIPKILRRPIFFRVTQELWKEVFWHRRLDFAGIRSPWWRRGIERRGHVRNRDKIDWNAGWAVAPLARKRCSNGPRLSGAPICHGVPHDFNRCAYPYTRDRSGFVPIPVMRPFRLLGSSVKM
jgi:hypothetical protein